VRAQVDQCAAYGKALLAYKVLRFTDRQDLKLTVGTHWRYSSTKRSTAAFTYVRICAHSQSCAMHTVHHAPSTLYLQP